MANIKGHCGAIDLDNGSAIQETFIDNGDGTFARLMGASGTVSIGVVTIADGGDVAQGASTDAAGANSLIGQLKAIVANTDATPDQYTRADTYTAAASGVTVDMTAKAGLVYALQIKGVGAAASAWNIVLETSLDGVNWSTDITHTNGGSSDGQILSATAHPRLYMRSRCVSLTLGGATGVVATILALR